MTIKEIVGAIKTLLLYDDDINIVNSTHMTDLPSLPRLRNLSKFLGMQTLLQNKPLFNKDIDLKQLLYDGN